MLRNIMEDEEFKRRQRLKSEQESRDLIISRQHEEPQQKKAKQPKKVTIMGKDDCNCKAGLAQKHIDDMTYEELVN